MEPAIYCRDLRRVFKSGSRETVALAGIDLEVPPGAVFGLLGPNGAGKTTLVRVLSTLLTPTSGEARVVGLDVARQARQVRGHIGFVLGGDRGLYGRLTARENLLYFAALNQIDPKVGSRRADELLEAVGLVPQRDVPAEQFSRGMRQRLHIARGLIADPEVVFMDEPTIGLDPLVAQDIRQLVPRLSAAGKTVLLTTHYMIEADLLCNTIALINHGRIVATGSPAEVKRQVSGLTVLELSLRDAGAALIAALEGIGGVTGVSASPEGLLQRVIVQAKVGTDLRGAALALIDPEQVESIVEREPTLEEAYVSILSAPSKKIATTGV